MERIETHAFSTFCPANHDEFIIKNRCTPGTMGFAPCRAEAISKAVIKFSSHRPWVVYRQLRPQKITGLCQPGSIKLVRSGIGHGIGAAAPQTHPFPLWFQNNFPHGPPVCRPNVEELDGVVKGNHGNVEQQVPLEGKRGQMWLKSNGDKHPLASGSCPKCPGIQS